MCAVIVGNCPQLSGWEFVPFRGVVVWLLCYTRIGEHSGSQVDRDGKRVIQLMAVLTSSPRSSVEQGRNLMSDCESDVSLFAEGAEGAGARQLVVKQTWTPLSNGNRMATAFRVCSEADDELALRAGDWDDFDHSDTDGRTSGDANRVSMLDGGEMELENSELSPFPAPALHGAPHIDKFAGTPPDKPDSGYVPSEQTGWIGGTERPDPRHDDSVDAESRRGTGLLGPKEAVDSERGLGGSIAADDGIGTPQDLSNVTILSDIFEQGRLEGRRTEPSGGRNLSPSEAPLFPKSGSEGAGGQVDTAARSDDKTGLACQHSLHLGGCEAELTGDAMISPSSKDVSRVSVVKPQQQNAFSASDAFGHYYEEDEAVAVRQVTRRKGCVVRLGSKEAEELLQLDVTKLGRASSQSMQGDTAAQTRQSAFDWSAEDLGPDELSRYVEKLEVKESYMDTVLDMESVLLEGDDSNRSRMFQDANRKVDVPSNVRADGGWYASTSGLQAFSKVKQSSVSRRREVVWVEVIGARQRRGGASLGERVVGVQEHTVYRIMVKGVDSEWEIDRRYRDFVLLHGKLLRLFCTQSGSFLPEPWNKVKGESRKLFGNTSPNVVEVRSALIQVCLQSLILAGSPLKTAGPLLDFLSPGDDVSWSSAAVPLVNITKSIQTAASLPLEDLTSTHSQSPRSDTASSVVKHNQDAKGSTVFGKTVRLIVQVHAHKPVKQQLQGQHHACAGCYKYLVSASGLVPSFAQTLGWAGPRLCEYTGQLFCSACHVNEVALLPAQVLQNWDFSPRKVSQLAKAYLDSIYDQPMLCVSAVNPHLYGKVPILANVRDMRKKLSRLVACLHCPARSRILAMVGSRRYLFENNDFFALRDLADLSKGAFAVLPGFMKTAWERLYRHITQECSVCYETGEACGAGQWCNDPFDTIFPFQDNRITRCPSCQLPFHDVCFTKSKECPSCHGIPPARLPDDTHSSSGYSTGESAKELANRKKSPLSTTSDGGGRSSSSGSSKRRSSKGSSHAGFKGSRTQPLVLNMSALSGPLEL